MDTFPIQAVWERLKEMGVPLEIVYFKTDELANQAVVSGQIEIGSGTPYGIIQRMNETGKATIRFFFQRSTLEYVPVVRTSKYQSWEDLDGHEIAVHARASGTEAQAKLAEELFGIKFSRITYVPGQEVRAVAMRQGTMDASFLGLFTMKQLLVDRPGEFMVLPYGESGGSDDGLFARLDWLQENEELVKLIIKETLRVYRRSIADPTYAEELREHYNLCPDLPPEITVQIPDYYDSLAKLGLRSVNGGGLAAAEADLEFYSIGGQLTGEDLKVEDFWYLDPLNEVLDEVGRISIHYE
jgi:NitT/TauT family transport system substrate-binding protein